MNRPQFYAQLRKRAVPLFGTSLTVEQVAGIEAILDECHLVDCDLGQTAYILATAHGETGARMQPIRENMNYSAARLRKVWPSRFPDMSTANRYAGKPRDLANYVYNGRLGNRLGSNDGWDFRGALIGQVTGRSNFTQWGKKIGVDLVGEPSVLDRLDVAVKCLVRPMMEGWATGAKLPAYVSGSRRDYVGARAVWNGSFEAKKYADRALIFEEALLACGWGSAKRSTPPLTPKPVDNSMRAETVVPTQSPAARLKPWAFFTNMIGQLIGMIFAGKAKR